MAKAGSILVAVPGTAVPGPVTGPGEFLVKAHPNNTGLVYAGNDGADDVDSTNGYPLAAGDAIVLVTTGLDAWRFDAAVAGEGVRWIRVTHRRGQADYN